jgi:hypothetical protein
MAFEILRFVRQTSAYNAGQISTTFNPNTPTVLENGPAIFSYASATDAIATIGGANYFADVVYELSVNDLIFAVGSDASAFYQVATVDRDAQTITVVSAFPSGVIGTANINNLAVTTAKIDNLAVTNGKIAANAVDSSKLDTAVLQYAAVAITAAEFNGMYAAPKLLIAAGGADTQIIVDQMVLAMTYGAAQFAAGGVVAAQYDSTVHGAGVLATATEAAADFTGAAASTSFRQAGSLAVAPFSTSVNKGIYLSNQTAAFTTGDSTFVAHVWYRVIPTV